MENQKPEQGSPDDLVSKSQLKREAKELFVLGKSLSELPLSELATLPMEDRLREAIEEVGTMRSNGARKRQLGFVAKMLRHAEVEPLQEALELRSNDARVDTARLHRAETWRDALIEHGDGLLAELVDRFPDADPQNLRQLVRNSRRERDRGKPPASARKLFRLLRSMDELQSLPGIPEQFI